MVNPELPPAFITRVHEIVPSDLLDQVLKSYSETKPTTFRANRLKITHTQLQEELQNKGILFEKVQWFEDAFILKSEDSRILTESDFYSEGKIYVQSLSSMIPPLVLDAQRGEQVLDLCAAPGSKTTQIAAMMNNEGFIYANDLSTVRIYKLAHNLKLQGVSNAKTIRGRGEDVWKRNRQKFDRVLADVPCSLEGRFSLLDPKSYDGWSEKKVKDLAQRMKFLLWSAVNSTKPGGTIVYSTCTMSPEENEGVVDWVLEKEKGKLVMEAIEIPGLSFNRGLTSWRKAQYSDELELSARIFPSNIMEGFYVAKLKVVA